MTFWSIVEAFDLFAIGKRLGLMLVIIAVYCVIVGLVIHRWDYQALDWGSAASLINTVILSLLLSFRNRAAYDRWWEARGLWGQLTNDSRNLAAKIAAFVPGEEWAHGRVADLLAGFAEALKRQLRGESAKLQQIAGFEHETAEPSHLPLYVASRLYAVVAEWKRARHVDDGVLRILDPHLRGLLDVCGGCERIRNTPLSPSYKILLRTGLVVNMLAVPWLIMPELGFVGVPAFLLVCFFLLAVELIDSVVEEPFGHERDDLDLDRYCLTIREGIRASLVSAGQEKMDRNH
jgi:putative membrane protein